MVCANPDKPAISAKPAKFGKQPNYADRALTKYIKSLHPLITLLHAVCANPAKPAKIGQDCVIYKQTFSDSHSFSCHHSKIQHLLSTHTHINNCNTADWTLSISTISAKLGRNFTIYKHTYSTNYTITPLLPSQGNTPSSHTLT